MDLTTDSEKGKKGRLFIVSAPSGAGKTTLCKYLMKRFPDMVYSVSSTTRKPRNTEVDGKDYHFISKEEFEKGIQENRWAEWAVVYGNYYGTSASFMKKEMENGNDILLDIDVQGHKKIVQRFPEAISIFIMPPSLSVLRNRLEKRGQDEPDTIEKRIQDAEKEMAEKDDYTHVIVNDDLQKARSEIGAILMSYRKKDGACDN